MNGKLLLQNIQHELLGTNFSVANWRILWSNQVDSVSCMIVSQRLLICVCAVVVAILVTRIARDALRSAIQESGAEHDVVLVADDESDVRQPLIVRIDTTNGIDGAQPLVHKALDSVL